MDKNCYIGEINKNTKGTKMEIIKIINKNNLSVKFLDKHGYIKDHVQYINFLRGQVKNPYDITVYTAGYIGVGIHKVAIKQKITDVYKAWSSMLRRCYSESNAQNNKSYYNKVTVCDKWHNFQNFGDWYESNKYKCDGRLHVDKDILYPGNKVYSSETCILVPQSINALFINIPNKTGLPNGVRLQKNGKYLAVYNSKTYGYYDTIEEAYAVHAKFKKEDILNRIYDIKYSIPQKLIKAIENFEFKIENDVNYQL